MDAYPRILQNYVTADDREPFSEWLEGLGDGRARNKISIRLNRVEQGNFGECRSVGGGVHELVVDYGPGYRVYFGNDGDEVILLVGGDKSTQAADIKRATAYWEDYNA